MLPSIGTKMIVIGGSDLISRKNNRHHRVMHTGIVVGFTRCKDLPSGKVMDAVYLKFDDGAVKRFTIADVYDAAEYDRILRAV